MSDAELKFPFARELQEQHQALRAAVRWFHAEFEGERHRGAPRGAAHEFLRVIRDQLVEHFRFEELDGFEGGMGSDPEIQRRTQEFTRQHRDFEGRLGALLSRLDESRSDEGIPAPLLAELAHFFADLRRHDAEENALFLRISRAPADPARDIEGS